LNVLAIVGSPRKRGNTDLLIEKILEGARSKKNDVQKISLYDLEIGPCIDCRRCQGNGHECVIKDDMENIYQRLSAADVIILGTPLYWYGPTAPMKAFIDRLRPFISSKKLNGKEAIVVVPSEEGAGACGPLTEMFKLSLDYLGVNLMDSLLVKAYEKGEVMEYPDALEIAFALGSGISKR